MQKKKKTLVTPFINVKETSPSGKLHHDMFVRAAFIESESTPSNQLDLRICQHCGIIIDTLVSHNIITMSYIM